jgi:hypothetical protein
MDKGPPSRLSSCLSKQDFEPFSEAVNINHILACFPSYLISLNPDRPHRLRDLTAIAKGCIGCKAVGGRLTKVLFIRQ